MLAAQSCPTLRPHGVQPTRLLLSMRFSRQGYWSGLPFPSPGDLPKPGIEPGFPALQADSLLTELQGKPHTSYLFLPQREERALIVEADIQFEILLSNMSDFSVDMRQYFLHDRSVWII